MEGLFEKAFVKALRKHAGIKKQVENKVRMIMEQPLALGEPLKGSFRGFYSCAVKKSFIIIYLYCHVCRKKGDDAFVVCSDCSDRDDETIKFVFLGPHDEAGPRLVGRGDESRRPASSVACFASMGLKEKESATTEGVVGHSLLQGGAKERRQRSIRPLIEPRPLAPGAARGPAGR